MSCFVHHMIRKGVFADLGVPASEENARELNKKIAKIVGMEGKECPEVWKKVRNWLENPSKRGFLRDKLLNSH